MRRAGTESGLLGFCRKLTRDVFQLADPLLPAGGGKPPRDSHTRRRSLQIEPLEVRSLLSAAGFVAQVDPVWFQDVSNAAQSHAGAANWTAEGISSANDRQTVSIDGASDTYDWIVQFDTRYVGGITDIAQTASLLSGGGFQFQVICGLGIVGEVLVRSSGASLDSVADWLAADEHVAAYEEDALRQIESAPNDPSVSQLWGMSKIDAYSAWNISTGGAGSNSVIVAEIDTGVDYTHADLAANIWTNPNAGRDGFAGDIHGYDFANNDGDPMDDNGHGTHVAGTLGAVGNNGLGVTGVNWAVSIMPLKFMTGSGSGYLSDAIRAINYATMQRSQFGANVRVINASWGGGGFSAAMQTAIQAAGNAGILFVTAAGNDAANNDASPHYPAGYEGANIIAVAATDQNDQLASFSCYGAASVDLAAPGVSIYSTLPGNQYGTYSGTSMATPHVAGAAALAWALDPTATIADIRNALLQGVDHLGSLGGKVASGGRLNVFHTLQILQGNYSTLPTIGSLSVSANNVPRGTSVELIAAGATAPVGNATAVYFYQEINGNGVFDAGDSPIGADYSVVGGVGTLHLDTTNWAPGTCRFFARTLDSNYQFSNSATTTLTLNAAGMSGFVLSANDVVQGTTVSLIGQGMPTGGNGYLGVYFYQDANNNGVFDARDYPIGASLSIVNGSAQLSLNTAGYTPGTYQFFARALGTNYRFGDALSQTLTVRAAGLQSFSLSANNVAPGGTVDLLAQCPAAVSANTLGVYYYQDTNNNGVFDAQDSPIGADMNLESGLAKLSLNTSGWKTGVYQFFARALDAQYRFGSASAATLTLVSAKAPNDAPSSTPIASGATLAGKLDAGGKQDWFAFQAAAGTSYTIRTELVTLRDSMLHLYDSDGKTLLASNDDGDSGLSSRIDWTAPQNGTYYFKVFAFDKSLTGDYRVSLAANATRASLPQAAGVQAVHSATSFDPRFRQSSIPAAGASLLQTTSFGNRISTNPAISAIYGGSTVSYAQSDDRGFDASAATTWEGTLDRASLLSESSVLSSTAEQRENDRSPSLLDRHPALRSVLSSMLLEDESAAAEPVKSAHLDLDALDALFARLLEEDLAGK